jgi:hypothetical protein
VFVRYYCFADPAEARQTGPPANNPAEAGLKRAIGRREPKTYDHSSVGVPGSTTEISTSGVEITAAPETANCAVPVCSAS